MGTVHENLCMFMIISHRILFRIRNVSVVEKIKIYILCQITFHEDHIIYEIIWKNTVEADRPQITI